MRRFAIGCLLTLIFALPAQAEMVCTTKGAVTNCETPGNLAPTQKRGCIPLSAADASMSPADLAVSVLACARKGKTDDAGDMMVLMLARGRFDMDRVADRTAHQGITVLQMEIGAALNPAQADAVQARLKALVGDPKSAEFASLCQKIAALGVPTHDPSYMIAHGIKAFTEGAQDGLVPGFKPKAAWQDVMQSYLKCPG